MIGLVLGLGIAKGMSALFAAMGVDLPKAGTVLATRTIIVVAARGHDRSRCSASIVPALRATRVPPISAVREGATLPPSRFAAHSPNAGVGVIGAALALIALGVFAAA